MNELQRNILSVCKRLDGICKKYDIPYFIMGGTALGAVRHGGFIPWDDDIDVFMTPESFARFCDAVDAEGDKEYYVDTVGLSDSYVEYAKFKKRSTTLIERVYIGKENIRHNLFVDIMILRRLPDGVNPKKVYRMSQLVSFLTIAETEWKPKKAMHKLAKKLAGLLPRKWLAERALRRLEGYEREESFSAYCYFMSRVRMSQGIFPREIFESSQDIIFEDTTLSAPVEIRKYLAIRYGEYNAMPPESKRVGEHAFFFDSEREYTLYIDDFSAKYAVFSIRREQSEEVKTLLAESGIETDKGIYQSGGYITHIDDLRSPLSAVYIRGNSDIGEIVKILRRMKPGEVCVFDVDGQLSQKAVRRLAQSLTKCSVTAVSVDTLKKRLHGKLR